MDLTYGVHIEPRDCSVHHQSFDSLRQAVAQQWNSILKGSFSEDAIDSIDHCRVVIVVKVKSIDD